jgi:clan AA aspartic protease
MGLTYVTVRLAPLSGKKSFEREFLVDTGAIDCVVSSSSLRRIGVRQEGKDAYELANGETVELPFGFARVRFMGSETVSKVVFGPDDAEPLLGVTALESTGIGVDPVTRALRRMTAKPLK